MNNGQSSNTYVYVGSYTEKAPEGIYVYSYNADTGELHEIDRISGLSNPSFLTTDASNHQLYAVSETMEFQGEAGGSVASYTIEPSTGKLTFVNEQPTFGGAPCHISLDSTGKYALVANYMGGNVCLYPLQASGEIGNALDVKQHEGSGPSLERQQGPHAHSITPDPANSYVMAADLGLDQVIIYKLDTVEHKLVPHGEVNLKPGAGPRHFVFSLDGQFAYVINELDSTITAFTYDGDRGELSEIQTISTLPADFQGNNSCADIHISPSGRFLYGSNRGHDSIVVYEINEAGGTLSLVEHMSTFGNTPRNFAIAPNGKFLLAANQDSDTIITFAIDELTGRLRKTDKETKVSQPVCIHIMA